MRAPSLRDRRILSSLYWVLACSVGAGSVAAEVTAPAPAVEAQRRVFLTAADQKLRIAESLERAGIHVVDDILAAPELLRVTIGASKGVKDCGTYNNVRYALRADGEDVVSFAVEGWTGSCVPNVFDDLSERLASEIASKDRAGGERSP